ncbi:hypothetical protein GQ53DRAFT_866123 [Thozetella sp. PMI_491]|nr:hypothetical protein GQ53DRAFT_866123 [Thozetella sp. PMI_491]
MEVTKPDQSSELYTATETEVAVPQATAVAEACTLVSTADDGETPNGSTLKDRLKTATDAAFWKHAYAETKHFASGILSQTTESNKHYTILRHSPPMIMYRGGSTSVTISIFSSPSHPLPADRTLWLQRRGFSGDTGLKIRAMISADGDWVDVTPRHQTEASKLEEADERAWQRDLGRITEKEAKKGDKGHLVRETHVVRIPAAAEDGYFRLALCTGGGGRRRVLCASPIFRLTSASADPSVFRGAGLASMPLELSVKVASMVGQAHVQTLIAPVTSITDRLQPGFVTQTVAQTAYDMSGLEDKVTARVKSDATATTAPETNDKSATDGNVLGAEDGPEAPFPIKFSGTLTPSTSDVTAETGLFAATLGGVPDHVVVQLKGCYLGWACIKPPKADGGGEDDSAGKTALLDWHGALILVGPDPHEGPSVAARPVVRVYMLHDFGTAQPSAGAKIKAIAMGLLRAKDRLPTDPEKAKMMLARDADTARASLARETWGATAALEALAATKSARSLTDKYVDARALIRRRTDSIPLHRLGIRGSNSELLDKLHGTGGFWVAR